GWGLGKGRCSALGGGSGGGSGKPVVGSGQPAADEASDYQDRRARIRDDSSPGGTLVGTRSNRHRCLRGNGFEAVGSLSPPGPARPAGANRGPASATERGAEPS